MSTWGREGHGECRLGRGLSSRTQDAWLPGNRSSSGSASSPLSSWEPGGRRDFFRATSWWRPSGSEPFGALAPRHQRFLGLAKKFLVLLLTFDSVDGSFWRLAVAGLGAPAGQRHLGQFQPPDSSDTLAVARLLGGAFLNGFNFDRLQPSSADATLANAIKTRPATATHRRLLTA